MAIITADPVIIEAEYTIFLDGVALVPVPPPPPVITAPVFRRRLVLTLFQQRSEAVPVLPSYRLLIVNTGGKVFAELENANMGLIPWDVTEMTTFPFTLPANDPKAVWLQEMRYEVQVWRNGALLWGGPIVRTVNDGKIISVQCNDVSYYFACRVMGRVPKKNLLALPDGRDGEPATRFGWTGRSLPRGGSGSPAITTSLEDSYNDFGAMILSSSAGRETETFANDDWFSGTAITSQAEDDLTDILDVLVAFTNRPNISVKVYDDNSLTRDASIARAQARCEAISDWVLDEYNVNFGDIKVTTAAPAYRHPLNNNSDAGEREANRRTVVEWKSVDGAKGHKQHVRQIITVRNPSPNKRRQPVTFSAYVYVESAVGWAAGMKGIELVRADITKPHPDKVWADAGYKKPLQTEEVTFGNGFPKGSWVRVEATVTLPNNGKRSTIETRIFPPNGDLRVSEMWLTREESLAFKDQEQADIIRALVAHAQDESLGKSNLNITVIAPRTGVKRTREYLYSERATIADLLEEFPTLAGGMEWKINLTPDRRYLTTHYPRMGQDKDYVFASGSNVVSYSVASDGALLSTTVVVQAHTGSGSSREERVASDPTLMDGLVLEKVYTGTPNSPASSWRAQAERGLARYRRPITIPTLTMDPSRTDEMLRAVQVGDRVITNISEDVANIDTIQKVRINSITLDPKTDTLSYTVYPEDIGVRMLSNYGSSWRYYSQAQNPIVGAAGKKPVQSDIPFSTRAYDDSEWDLGPGPLGWVKDASGTGPAQNPFHEPNTIVPDTHEVWGRKWVACTGDMVLSIKVADWGYVYVNGHLIGNTYFEGANLPGKAGYLNVRIPSSWLDPSGAQLIAIHAQFSPARRSSTDMDSLLADVAARGTYNIGETDA